MAGDVSPVAMFFFLFERPLLRYLLKSVLHRAALLHCLGLLAAVWTNSTRKDKVNQTSQCIGPAPVGRLIWQVGSRFQSHRPLTNLQIFRNVQRASQIFASLAGCADLVFTVAIPFLHGI